MWLALETSADCASVAVGRPGAVTSEASLEGARKHAGALPGLIDQVLARAGVELSAIEAIVLGDGPGSFTGLRVGAAVAKALVRARAVALHTMPSLVSVAWAARPSPSERVLAVANALRGEIYAAEYRFPDGLIEVLQPPAVWLPERLLADGLVPDVVSGAIPEGLAGRLAEWQGGRQPRTVQGVATAAALLELAARRGGLVTIADAAGWQPVYGRPAEAQAKWEREHGHALPDSTGHLR